jgi:hypothetical protein
MNLNYKSSHCLIQAKKRTLLFPVLSAFSAFLAIPTTNPPCSANRGRKELQFKKKLKLNKN